MDEVPRRIEEHQKQTDGIMQLLITANSRHFLRVNAQMHNLDKQKTAQIRIPLGASGGLTFRRTKADIIDKINIDNLINFKDFKLSFDSYKDEVDKILTSDLNFLWMNDYHDGMLCGMLEYRSQYYKFEIITDFMKGIYPRVFAIIILTKEQIADEIFWHDLFVKHVGNHNDFNGPNELITKPQSEHHLFYDKFENRPEVNYETNIVKGWFIEQVGH